MKSMLKKLIAAVLVLIAANCWADENYMYFDYQISLLVFDPEAVQEMVLDWVNAQGGSFIFRSDGELQLRIPWKASTGLREFLTGSNVEILEYNQNAVDLREEIFRLKSGIKSRQEILARNTALISRADTAGTLAIEQEVMRLIAEIEQSKGRLNKLEYDRVMAYVTISFNFKQSSRPENVASSFDWLNQVDMYDFLEGGVR